MRALFVDRSGRFYAFSKDAQMIDDQPLVAEKKGFRLEAFIAEKIEDGDFG